MLSQVNISMSLYRAANLHLKYENVTLKDFLVYTSITRLSVFGICLFETVFWNYWDSRLF